MAAIAIDGPAGAGKSTVARATAEELGFTYIDTGAMYRAVALRALEDGIDPGDPEGVTAVASSVTLEFERGRILVDGRDVTASIRAQDVTLASAEVARHPGVREALVRVQRRLARSRDVVMEGRDIGTKVLPEAPVKVFLTASLDERATRRGRDVGVDDGAALDRVKTAIERRDASDMNRSESPLVQADDAVVVDSTGKTIAEVVAEVVELARGSLR